MGSADTIDIKYVAELARVELDDTQAEQLQRELAGIVGYIDELKELNVDGIEPTAHAMPRTNVWREDAAKDSLPRKTMLANAPAIVAEELLRVPKVLPGTEGN